MAKKKAVKTARLHDLEDRFEDKDLTIQDPYGLEDKDLVTPDPAEDKVEAVPLDVRGVGGFNPPRIDVPKGERSYTGPATKLMNELYDVAALNLPVEMLPGWERIAFLIAKACDTLEKAGWKKGR